MTLQQPMTREMRDTMRFALDERKRKAIAESDEPKCKGCGRIIDDDYTDDCAHCWDRRRNRERRKDPAVRERQDKRNHRKSVARDPSRRRAWTKEAVLEAIYKWADEYGGPPISDQWQKRVAAYPSTATVCHHFGSWANAIEAAGFERPVRGRAGNKGAAPPQRWLRVPGTGLSYRSPDDAYVAADEIEADGERIASDARFDGDETRAEKALDSARDLAQRVRAAALNAEQGRGHVPPDQLAGPLLAALAAAARAFADELEKAA